MDLLLTWLHCLVAGGCPNPAALAGNPDKDVAITALLLDRRLIKAKGPRLTSFIGGGVLAFLPDASLFPDSTVLDAVPPDTLEAFTSLIRHALGMAGRRCYLLYRSSRDGATATAFHGRCDAKGPTLTLIKDTAGNVFGGYTSLHWSNPPDFIDEFGNNHALVGFDDPATFLFTVVNPHADPPAQFFPSNASGSFIVCSLSSGPRFGNDLYVFSDIFDGNCYTYLGATYENPTRHSGGTVLAGTDRFTPEEVEVEVWGLADD